MVNQATVEAATYYVEAEFKDDELVGSGFCIRPEGLIMTCSHVISYRDNGEIMLPEKIYVRRVDSEGRTLAYEAEIVKNGDPSGPMLPEKMTDPNGLDLALLRIKDGGSFPFILFNEAGPPVVNDPCYSFGAFIDLEELGEDVLYYMEQGQVTGVFANPNGTTVLIRHQCPIIKGFSGGPLTADNSNVIGVNVLEYPNDPRRYAIAAAAALAFIPT